VEHDEQGYAPILTAGIDQDLIDLKGRFFGGRSP
jgi:hypothetical protein